MTFCKAYPLPEFKLQRIDDLLRQQHSYLESSDLCFFLGESASGLKFEPKTMHQLIFNFKKPIEKKGQQDWHYKEKAIKEITDLILNLRNWEKWSQYTWIPMPSSKIPSDSGYDDRLLQVLSRLKNQYPALDVRNILFSKRNRESAHSSGHKKELRTIEFHQKNLEVITSNEVKTDPPKVIVIFDDLITSGAQFKATQSLLRNSYPQAVIVGFFIARNNPGLKEQ